METCETLRAELGPGTRVLAIGPAGENRVSFSTLLADDGASASGGFGAVMGSKMLKAIAVAGNEKPIAADPDRLRRLSQVAVKLRKGAWEGHIPIIPKRTKPKPCYGCTGCFRQSYEAEGGRQFKFHCQAADIYRRPAEKYYNEHNEVPLLAIRLCDTFGLDTAVTQPMIEWLVKCHKEGVLQEKEVGLPLSKIGSAEFIEGLIRKISFREGFGDLLARGTTRAARSVGKRAEELSSYVILTRANDLRDYDPRLFIANGLLYATEPRRPIQQLHEMGHALIRWLGWLKGKEGSYLSTEVLGRIAGKFWGGPLAADFSTYEGKALAAKKIQDRAYAKESLVLCDIFWPILWVKYSEDHVGDPTLESQIFSAVTGRKVSPEALDELGERVFNLQRALLLREGWGGREGDHLLNYLFKEPLQFVRFNRECIVPGRDGNPVSRRGEMINREEFENLKSEYYELRGWDVTSGFQTKGKLKELEMEDIARDLEGSGLLK
jgi:aldehyde:ferredoxin oxidoreductase